MPESLDVNLNRDGPHSIEVATPTFEADSDFDIVLRNHGKALHVYLNLDDDLATVAELGTANHYVDEESVRRVRVHVDNHGRSVRGRMKIVTGYGSETEYVNLSIVFQGTDERRVRVDERLGKPQPTTEEEPIIQPERLPVLALAAVALLVAILAGVVIADPVVLVGVLIVIFGVAIAGAILWGDYALE